MLLATKVVFLVSVTMFIWAQVLRLVAAGVSKKQVAAVFGVSRSTNSNLLTKFHETGDVGIHTLNSQDMTFHTSLVSLTHPTWWKTWQRLIKKTNSV